jgi:phospholipase C
MKRGIAFDELVLFTAAAVAAGVVVASLAAGCARTEVARPLDAAQVAAQRSQCAFAAGAPAAATLAAPEPVGDAMPIDTIVVVVLEGRSFDHLLGSMNGVDGPPDDAMNVDASGRAVPITHGTRYCVADPGDDWKRSHVAFDGGSGRGFVKAAAPVDDDPTGARVMSRYGADDLPVLHGLATRFAVADRYFASMLAGATQNRAFLYAGTSHGAIDDRPIAADAATIFGSLDGAGVDWRVYGGDASRPAALAAIRAQRADHFSGSFGADARAGRLPPVSFVEAAPTSSGGGRWDFRAPGDVQLGDRYLSELYAEVTASPQWPRMAVLVTFADAGGFYDHELPPAACRPDAWGPGPGLDALPFTFDRAGFRVPLVVVSPWARAGAVAHDVYDHTSILRFIERRFALPALTARDANADPLTALFDFAAVPRLDAPALSPRVDSEELDRCVETYL